MPERGLVRGARGFVEGWASQSVVLAPWDGTAVAAPMFHRQLLSTNELGINCLLSKVKFVTK